MPEALPRRRSWSASSPGVPTKIAASDRYGAAVELVEAGLAPLGARPRSVVEDHDEVGEDPQRRRRPSDGRARRRARRRPSGATSAVSAGVTNTTSAERAANSNGTWQCASAATSGWPCGGRGTIDGPLTQKNRALEVDVVQLVAVDEPAGGDVADIGVVLPAVPQPAHDLDHVGGLVEEVADDAPRPPDRRSRRVERRGTSRRPTWRGLVGRPETCGRQPARPRLT